MKLALNVAVGWYSYTKFVDSSINWSSWWNGNISKNK